MIGTSSASAGVLLLQKSGVECFAVFDLIKGEEKNPNQAHYLYSMSQDWQEIEASDEKVLIEKALKEYWIDRSVSLFYFIITGLDDALENKVLEHLEEIVGSHDVIGEVLNRLLIAPLADQSMALTSAKSALNKGFYAVASILNELVELQPLLRKFSDNWLDLPVTAFDNFSITKQEIWSMLVENGPIKDLLKVTSGNEFANKWNLLAFAFKTAQDRFNIKCLGNELSLRLFPHERLRDYLPTTNNSEYTSLTKIKDDKITAHEAYTKAEKQMVAIVRVISEGHDSIAKKYLRELIQSQISIQDGKSFAIKSLCNIAQRCAEMFRTDFEAICLRKAIEIDSQDAWTLVQYGDHLKRIGKYKRAIEILDEAAIFGESSVAISSKADVYSQQGDYPTAIKIYKTLPKWEEEPIILNAIADNLRKMGQIEEAERKYREIINEEKKGNPEFVGTSVRSYFGIAEVMKRKGRLEESLANYHKIHELPSIDFRDKIYYSLGVCNVLKLMEKFDQAFKVAAELIQDYPFIMEARFIRGSILGLIGQELEGLEDLPESSSSQSWREWLRPYYRGLLLLKLKRYEDAQKSLLEELPKAIASGEDKAILRMAAALWFLRDENIAEVDAILSEIPPLSDCYTRYLLFILQLHSATIKKDKSTIESIRAQIGDYQGIDKSLDMAIVALSENNFMRAISYETSALLKIAA